MATVRLELPEQLCQELVAWLWAREKASVQTAEYFDQGRDLTDWFSRQVADESRKEALRLAEIRLSIEKQLKEL
jgi:hypothetical protein